MLVEPVKPVLSSFFIESIQVVECLGEKETEEDIDKRVEKKVEKKVEEKLEELRKEGIPIRPNKDSWKEDRNDPYEPPEPPDLGWSTKWTTAVAKQDKGTWVRNCRENFTTAESDNQEKDYHYEWR